MVKYTSRNYNIIEMSVIYTSTCSTPLTMNYSLGVFIKNIVFTYSVDNENPLYFARTYVHTRNCIAKMRAIARLVFLKITVKQKPHPLYTCLFNYMYLLEDAQSQYYTHNNTHYTLINTYMYVCTGSFLICCQYHTSLKLRPLIIPMVTVP